jgi:hypothetical protein
VIDGRGRITAGAAPFSLSAAKKQRKPRFVVRTHKRQSGNPGGRPSGARSIAALLGKALDERVAVSEDGKPRKLAGRQLGIAQLAETFAKGDRFAVTTVLDILMRQEASARLEPLERPPLQEADKLVIANFLTGLRRLAKSGRKGR